jgi:hypothetical protein
VALPLAPDWVKLTFDDAALPNSFVVLIENQGTDWGQCSAVALRKDG